MRSTTGTLLAPVAGDIVRGINIFGRERGITNIGVPRGFSSKILYGAEVRGVPGPSVLERAERVFTSASRDSI